jgi:hypothetical protein
MSYSIPQTAPGRWSPPADRNHVKETFLTVVAAFVILGAACVALAPAMAGGGTGDAAPTQCVGACWDWPV